MDDDCNPRMPVVSSTCFPISGKSMHDLGSTRIRNRITGLLIFRKSMVLKCSSSMSLGLEHLQLPGHIQLARRTHPYYPIL